MSSGNGKRPSFMPEVRQFSQADERVVQRPEGITGPSDEGLKVEDIRKGQLDRYADLQVSPGRYDEAWPLTAQPQGTLAGGVVVLIEKDLGFMAHSVLIDNWTNQWLWDENLRRNVLPYSGGWVFLAPKGYQKARITLKVPSASYAPAAVIAGEYVFIGWHEATLNPATGIVVLTKTPVVV